MGQYWLPVNLTKKEFIDPHKLASGLKLWEIVANDHVGKALCILLAAMPERRGGGDLDLDENWHGPERTFPEHSGSPGPMSEDYQTVAKRTIGRWVGGYVTLVGDYAEDCDYPCPEGYDPASKVYGLCSDEVYKDITDDVCRVIEHELNGKFSDTQGWRDFKYANQ